MKAIVFTLVLLFSAVVVLAQQPCCSPTQWQGSSFGQNLFNGNRFFNSISYDYKNQRQRIDFFADISFNKTIETIIERYDLGYVYVINPATGACTYTPVSGTFHQACIPPYPTSTYQFTLGGSLLCTDYVFEVAANYTEFISTSSFCVPVRGFYIATQNNVIDNYAQWNWFDITSGISDPIIFSPPTGCTKSSGGGNDE